MEKKDKIIGVLLIIIVLMGCYIIYLLNRPIGDVSSIPGEMRPEMSGDSPMTGEMPGGMRP